MTHLKTSKSRLALTTCAALVFVAACGNNERAQLNRQVFSNVLGQVTGNNSGPARVTAEQIAQAQATASGPLLLVDFEAAKSSALFLQIATNGPVATFATGARQTVSMENGALRGTRALGDDLMSSDQDTLRLALATGEPASGPRELRYLNGAGESYSLTFNCTYSGGLNVTETCKGTNEDKDKRVDFTNTYQRTEDGIVSASRQWVSPSIGYMTFTRIQ